MFYDLDHAVSALADDNRQRQLLDALDHSVASAAAKPPPRAGVSDFRFGLGALFRLGARIPKRMAASRLERMAAFEETRLSLGTAKMGAQHT
jgi:hypothetical protein